MLQKILYFELKAEQKTALEKTAKQLGIRLTAVPRADYMQKVGALAGIPGFPKTAAAYKGMAGIPEMIICCGMNSDQLDAYLKVYGLTGAEKIPYKATITPVNAGWTALQLYKEISDEHRVMNARV